MNIGSGQPGQFGNPEPGLAGQHLQSVVAAPEPSGAVQGGDQCVDLVGGEVGDDGPVTAFRWDGQNSGDVGGVFVSSSSRVRAAIRRRIICWCTTRPPSAARSTFAKKNEQLGQLPNAGRQWRPKGNPIEVEDHSFYFIGPDVEVAIPLGVYDIANDAGWVNVGCDHDTSVFAV